MPRAATICPETDCLKPVVAEGKCARHGRKPWANTSKRNLNKPKNEKSLNRAVRGRDKVCRKCGSKENLEVDHRWPIARGGTWTLANMWLLCKSCHKEKTLRDALEQRA